VSVSSAPTLSGADDDQLVSEAREAPAWYEAPLGWWATMRRQLVRTQLLDVGKLHQMDRVVRVLAAIARTDPSGYTPVRGGYLLPDA
jgi:hypothetical protein